MTIKMTKAKKISGKKILISLANRIEKFIRSEKGVEKIVSVVKNRGKIMSKIRILLG